MLKSSLKSINYKPDNRMISILTMFIEFSKKSYISISYFKKFPSQIFFWSDLVGGRELESFIMGRVGIFVGSPASQNGFLLNLNRFTIYSNMF